MKTGLAIVAAALVAFGVGFWTGRESGGTSEQVLARLAALEEDVAALAERPSAAPTPSPPPRRGPDPAKVHDVEVGDSPVRGAEDAAVTIVEFSDFQCPYCGRVGPTLERLLEEYPDQVRLVYKHLPLSFHRSALPAAKAAVAAGRQDRFWEMHDLIFENQGALTEEKFLEHARALGLDVERFQQDYASEDVAREIAEDMNQARRLGVTGTPGFFINGRFTSGAQPYESFKSKIEAELRGQT